MDKEKLLKAIEQKRQEIWPTNTGEMKPATVPNNLESGWLNALAWMERYINSLPEVKHPSEDLDEEIRYVLNKRYGYEIKQGSDIWYTKQYQDDYARLLEIANWQKEQMMKSAIEGCWIKRNRYTKENVLNGLSVTCDAIQKFRDGDKVRVLILKDDEQ